MAYGTLSRQATETHDPVQGMAVLQKEMAEM
jgi:hypothetical protein